MSDLVLVLNAGSSSLKYQVVDPVAGSVATSGRRERIGEPGSPLTDHRAAFETVLDSLAAQGPDLRAEPPLAVGHRVVHGGARFTAPTVVDEEVVAAIRELEPLAPLHNPANLTGILIAREALPGVPQVAVFDTAFHATIPASASTYAVPREWRERHGVRRYGFHGTSHAHVSQRVSALVGRDDAAVVVLHLGNGASACAVLGGRSVETSMGLSPLEGLVMGTRSGDLDPATIGHICRCTGLSVEQVDHALQHDSGLEGLTGVNDFRTVQQRADAGDAAAAQAIAVMVHRLVKYVGAYAAVMGRLDAIAFTGGIGENAVRLRAVVLDALSLFGFELDAAANAAAVGGGSEHRITTPGSRVAGYVVPPGEELEIARQCMQVLQEVRRDRPA
ncbi:MAG: acetate kinase [Kineosporiaceae bacterium]